MWLQTSDAWVCINKSINSGGLAEWFNAPVLKTDEGESLPRVRIPEPPPLQHIYRLAMAYKLKFQQQAYKPKFKQKELIQIARKICSTPEGYKSTIDPVEFQWFPKKDIVYLHMTFDSQAIDEQQTWTLAFPMRPFEIGYDKWIEELQESKK